MNADKEIIERLQKIEKDAFDTIAKQLRNENIEMQASYIYSVITSMQIHFLKALIDSKLITKKEALEYLKKTYQEAKKRIEI